MSFNQLKLDLFQYCEMNKKPSQINKPQTNKKYLGEWFINQKDIRNDLQQYNNQSKNTN
jgi:hypothetical protein